MRAGKEAPTIAPAITTMVAGSALMLVTSAISVLIPLAGESIHAGGSLVALRLCGLAAAAATVWFAAKLADHLSIRLSTPGLLFWLGYLAFEHSQITFGMSGMETQVWTLVLIGGACAFAYGAVVWLGVALAAAAMCRPDCLIWIGLCLVGSLRLGSRPALRLVGITAAGIAPWLIFTTLYFGSPLPNTVRAKSAGYTWFAEIPRTDDWFVQYIVRQSSSEFEGARYVVSPNFRGHGKGPVPAFPYAEVVQRGVLFLGALGAIRLARGAVWVIPAFVLAFSAYLMLIVRYWFPWYPISMLGLAALLPAAGLETFLRMWALPRPRLFEWVAAVGLIACYVLPLPRTFGSEARVQELIENRVRKRVGLWLREHARPGEYVAAECLGYLGYYSRLPFYDFPGLCSPRVVEVLQSHPPRRRTLGLVVRELHPDWLVLRPEERSYATGATAI